MKILHPFLVREAEYRSQTGLLRFRNDSRAFILVSSIVFDMRGSESGPLETFVGQIGVEKGQGERLEIVNPFLVCEAEYRSQTGLLVFRNGSRAFI